MAFTVYRQLDATDCGPACLRMIARHHGRSIGLEALREQCCIGREGVSLRGISDAAEQIGFRTLAARVPFDTLAREAPLPCIAHWKQNHFIVLYKAGPGTVDVADPACGLVRYSRAEFLAGWAAAGESEGVVLLLEPTPALRREEGEAAPRANGIAFMLSYLLGYKRYLLQLVLGLGMGSVLTLVFPFLTQAVVDVGITNQDIGFVYTVLLAQFMLFISQASVNLIRSWILLHIGARVNISIISDFLARLMKLPLAFFDTRTVGDLLQRVGDHRRIEQFLTSSTLSAMFSVVNVAMFAVVLAVYSLKILAVFTVGAGLGIGWVLLFLRRRSALDYKRFSRQAENQSTLVQLIQGMPELKINNSETQKRWEWERLQTRLFKLNVSGLALTQYQQIGMLVLLKGKDILIAFVAAKEVIEGRMTLGMMLAVQYVIGQLSGQIEQIIEFIHTAQDAKLSAERLSEVHGVAAEETPADAFAVSAMPEDCTLTISGLSFRYPGPDAAVVLNDLNLTIPAGNVTAIVGASGCGKTTLLKLLLKFYEPFAGDIRVGGTRLRHLNSALWRGRCGVVMQDGYLFSDTIANNIALGADRLDARRLLHAAEIAHMQDFVAALPLGFNTRIGPEGHGLSQGQKQRILIARAVYKNPDYLLFDEATSALDAFHERVVMEHLHRYFLGKTVVVIAHRLSTVRRAHQIVVLDKGRVAECGTHEQLTAARGPYYELVRNQLELGA